MLEEENAFYDAHKEEFHEKYLNKWLVITGDLLWGVYDKFAEASKNALESLEHGKIMIHRPSDDGRVIYIGPRARVKSPEGSKKPEMEQEITYSNGGELMTFTYPY